MINFIGLHFIHDIEYAGEAFQGRSMENELVKDVPYPPEPVLRIFNSNSPYNAVDLIALFQKQLGKVRTILAGDTCYERFFHLIFSIGKEA